MTVNELTPAIHSCGWVITDSGLDPLRLNALAIELESHTSECGRGGRRNLLDMPEVQSLARDPGVRAVAEAVLGQGCVAVRGIYFDKGPQANWKVPWHQDLTVAVA